MACYNFDVNQPILTICGRIVTERAGSQIILLFFPLHLSNDSALPDKHGYTKIASFHSNVVLTALPEFNHSLLDFFNFVDLQLIFTLL